MVLMRSYSVIFFLQKRHMLRVLICIASISRGNSNEYPQHMLLKKLINIHMLSSKYY